jgi:hypothetical protein
MLKFQSSLAVAAIGFVLFFSAISSGVAAGMRVLRGHVPEVVARLQPVGRLPATNRLHLAIGLPLRNQTELDDLLRRIYDPASPDFRHYLTPEQFTEMFGPTEQDYQAVIAFAESSGLTVTGTHPNRLLVDVDGPVADVEKAFHVTMRVYPHPTETRTFYSPDVEPSVESGIPMLDVSGLDNYQLPQPRILRRTSLEPSAKVTPNAGSGTNGTYMGNDFRAAYVPGISLNGSGQVVGLLEFDGYYSNDIVAYENLAGLTNVTLTNVLLDGFSGTPGSGNDEVALDIDMVISMAPGVSKIIIYEEPITSPWVDIISRMANDNLAKQLSCSWGGGSPNAACEVFFKQMASQGQSFFDASGDSDAFTGTVPFPSDSTNITQVGGTTLTTTGPGGSWVSEATWNRGGGVGSGGGISTYYSIPSWQTNINMTTNQGSTSKRNIPDVAMAAENIFIFYNNGQQETVGGTSAAAPLWAGFTALVNQLAVTNGQSTVGFINPAVYAIGKGASYTSGFNDITTGNNTRSGSSSKFYAVPGYDLCTGWGTPNGSSLIIALAAPDGFLVLPGRSLTVGGPVGGPFNVSSQNFSLTNSGAAPLNWSLINTSLWLNASPTGGTLVPGGQTNVTVSLNTVASNFAAGVYVANVWFTNRTGGFSQDRQLALQVGPLVQNGGFETGDFSFWTLMGSASYNFVDDGASISPHSGTYVAALGQYGSVAYLYQALPTVSNQVYLLSLWMNNPVAGSRSKPNDFQVQWNGNTIYNSTNMGVVAWTNLHFVVQAAAPSAMLQFGSRNDPFYCGLDDISLVPIPAPVFQSVVKTNYTIKLTWNVMTGLVYQVQYRTNLLQTNWINLGGGVNATNATMTTFDTNAILFSPRRFYRVILP